MYILTYEFWFKVQCVRCTKTDALGNLVGRLATALKCLYLMTWE